MRWQAFPRLAMQGLFPEGTVQGQINDEMIAQTFAQLNCNRAIVKLHEELVQLRRERDDAAEARIQLSAGMKELHWARAASVKLREEHDGTQQELSTAKKELVPP